MDETNPELTQPGTTTLIFRPGFFKTMINCLPPPKTCPFCGSREIIKTIKIYAHNDPAYDLFSVNVCKDHKYATNYRLSFGGGTVGAIALLILAGIVAALWGPFAGIAFGLFAIVMIILWVRRIIEEGFYLKEINTYLQAFIPRKDYDKILFYTSKINPQWLAEFDQLTRPCQIEVDYPKIVQAGHERYLKFRMRLRQALNIMLVYLLATVGFYILALVTNTFTSVAFGFLIINIVTFMTWIVIRVSETEDQFF